MKIKQIMKSESKNEYTLTGIVTINNIDRLFIYKIELFDKRFNISISVFKTVSRMSRYLLYNRIHNHNSTDANRNMIDFNAICNLQQQLFDDFNQIKPTIILEEHQIENDIKLFMNELFNNISFFEWKRKIFITNGL
jgi:hypothetical protein